MEIKRNGYYLVREITDEKIQPVVCLADAHLGHKNFNRKKFIEVVDWILLNDAFWFGGGDLIENSNKNSVGAGWAEQTCTPQEQIETIVELLSPIKDRCLGLINGNHEDRAFKQSGINPTQVIAGMLGVTMAGDEIFIIIANNKKDVGKGKAYTIYGCHTNTTNKNAGLAFNTMELKVSTWMNVDVMCKAHGHDLGFSPPSIRIDIDKNNLAVVEREMYYWLVGHYLNRPDSYIAKTSGRPKPLGTVAIKLDMDVNKPKRVTHERI